MKMQYREAVLTDAREIAALASKMWTSHTVEELAECFSAAINAPDCAVFLVTDGDKASDLHSADCGTIMWRERQAVLSAIWKEYLLKNPTANRAAQNSSWIAANSGRKKSPARNLQATASLTMRSADSFTSLQAFGKQTGSYAL